MKFQASLQDQFNDQTIKDQFGQVLSIFPGKEIKVGDKWEKILQVDGRMPAKYITTYTVKGIEGDHVSLSAHTNIGSANNESDNYQMEIKGTQNGSLLVDSKTGLVINAEFDQDMETKTQGMEIGDMPAFYTDGMQLCNIIGLCHNKRHLAERFAGEIHIKTCNDDPDTIIS